MPKIEAIRDINLDAMLDDLQILAYNDVFSDREKSLFQIAKNNIRGALDLYLQRKALESTNLKLF